MAATATAPPDQSAEVTAPAVVQSVSSGMTVAEFGRLIQTRVAEKAASGYSR